MKKDWTVIAHRGASKFAPENTINAFELAVKQKSDYVEFDVWETADKELVIVHDEKLPDKSGKKVSDVTYEELTKIYQQVRGIQVPTLEMVLQKLQNKIRLDVEIKFQGKESDILTLITNYFDREDFIVTSFFPTVIKGIKKLDKKVNVGYLMHPLRLLDWVDLFKASKTISLGCNYSLPYHLMVTKKYIRKCEKKGIKVWTWVINDEKRMKTLIRKGINGIITDDPQLAIKLKQAT